MIPTIQASPAETYDIELEHTLLTGTSTPRLPMKTAACASIDMARLPSISWAQLVPAKRLLITRVWSSDFQIQKLGVAVFNGDATTAEDADQIHKQGVPIVQIATVNGCHLDANLRSQKRSNKST